MPWQENAPFAIGVGIALFVVGMGQYWLTSWIVNNTLKRCNVCVTRDAKQNGPKQ